KNRLESELKVSVPLIRVIQGPSVAELAALLLSLLAGVDPALEAPPQPPPEGQAKDSLLLSLLSLREDERRGGGRRAARAGRGRDPRLARRARPARGDGRAARRNALRRRA